MSRLIAVSAPGKLVISGEYAVLDGAKAVSLAVNRRARVTLEPASADSSVLEVVTGVRQQFPFVWDAEGSITFIGEHPAERGALLITLLQQIADSLPAVKPSLTIVIDSSEFYAAENAEKLGLGSSAAVCVALTAALHHWFKLRVSLPGLCYQVHSVFQGGRGSGIDVATSLLGGVISFQCASAGLPDTHLLNWPQGLHMLPVWTGRAASTTRMLQKVELLKLHEPSVYLGLMGELQQIAAQLYDEWQRNNVAGVLDALAMYSYGMSRLDSAANVGIYSAEHVDFQRRAAGIGAVYKPSGAGGGDFGLVFSDTSASIEQLAADFDAVLVLADWSASVPGLVVKETGA